MRDKRTYEKRACERTGVIGAIDWWQFSPKLNTSRYSRPKLMMAIGGAETMNKVQYANWRLSSW